MKLYSIEGVSYDYALGRQRVAGLRSVRLQVEPGEFLALSGPSGSGKTTLLNLMGLLAAPTAGRVCFEGADVSHASEATRTALRRDRIGFVFQHFHLIAVLTALENVEYGLLRAHTGREARKLAMETLEAVGVANEAHRRPGEMSGGQQQRVAVARALAKTPSVVLADEPTASLDHVNGLAILALLKDRNRKSGLACVFSGHDPKMLAAADRVVALEDGTIV